jgi:hypothetical protein
MFSSKYGPRQKLLALGISFGAAVFLSAGPARSQSQTFSDLAGREAQAQAIEDIGSKGIIAPQSPDKFNPSGVFTRGDFAVAAQKLFGLPKPKQEYYFADVPKESPLYAAVQAAAPFMDRRAICPTCLVSSNFAPNVPVSRAHAAISLARMEIANKKAALVDPREVNSALAGIPDVGGLSPLARQLIATAIKSGAITPSSGQAFEPAATYDRGDIAVVLFNTEKLLNTRP